MRLLFATRNRGKLRELRELFGGERSLEVLGLDDLPHPYPEVSEDAPTFAANAAAKARAGMRATGFPTVADDSGLEVDALGGRPGVRSARYAGPGATDTDRIAKLLGELAGVAPEGRTARFSCAAAYIHPDRPDTVVVCEGTCEGHITTATRGSGGFGYDPIFFVEALGKTFAEADPGEKNHFSHRGQALRKLVEYLRHHAA